MGVCGLLRGCGRLAFIDNKHNFTFLENKVSCGWDTGRCAWTICSSGWIEDPNGDKDGKTQGKLMEKTANTGILATRLPGFGCALGKGKIN